MMRFLRLIVILSLSLATLLIQATRLLYAGESQSCAEYRQKLAQDDRVPQMCVSPLFTHMGTNPLGFMMHPLGFMRENTLYAGTEGALVCPTYDPLVVYRQIYQDTAARAKYLDSKYTSECKKLSPDTEVILVHNEDDRIKLRQRGDYEMFFGLRQEWDFLCSSLRKDVAQRCSDIEKADRERQALIEENQRRAAELQRPAIPNPNPKPPLDEPTKAKGPVIGAQGRDQVLSANEKALLVQIIRQCVQSKWKVPTGCQTAPKC